MQLLCVHPQEIEKAWPFARHYIASAYECGNGDDTFETTEADILAGRQLLWLVWNGAGIIGAGATHIIVTPRRKLCIVTAVGGIGVRQWLHLIATVEAYAKAEGCERVRMMGRPGWKRLFTQYHEPWIVLDKPLKD